MRENTARRNTLRRIRKDLLRQMRVVETLDTAAVFANSPVEIKEGCAVSDQETGELFLVLIFKSLSQRPIRALDIRILLYGEKRPGLPYRPYRADDFRYSDETATLGLRTLDGRVRKEKECKRETAIIQEEEFGRGIFLPLPESFFSGLQIELVRVTYADGGCEQLGLVSDPFDSRPRATRFDEIDGNLRASYIHVNPFEQAEKAHPIRVLPQEGKNVWLCCCGHKNPADVPLCGSCGRDKDWQIENLSEEKLRKLRHELDGDRTLHIPHDTSAYSQTRYLENKEDKERKEAQIKKVKWDLYVQGETEKDKRYWKMVKQILEIALLFAAILGIARLIQLGFELHYFGTAEELEESAHILWRMIR